MPAFLWTQTAGMCTPEVSVPETEGARLPDKRSLSDFLLLSSYFLKQERLEVTSSSFSYPLWSVLTERYGASILFSKVIFLSHQILNPLGREGLRPSDSFLAPASGGGGETLEVAF